MPDAEIIAIGSELLTPDKVDTNSLYLTEQLNTLGVEVRRKLVVGDDRALVSASVKQALLNAEIVIVTGGLGPTEDDVTRDAVADALGRKLEFRDDLMAALAERFKQINRTMAENNKRQAWAVEGAEGLPNPRGTAPGQWIAVGERAAAKGRVLMMLPGPPRELKGMFTEECLPRLTRMLPAQVIRTRLFRVAGMGESDLDLLISPVYKPFENPVTTILAGPGDIQIHLRARGASEEVAEGLLNQIAPEIERLLGDRIYSRDGSPIEMVVGNRLRELGATLSVAESCTGGLLGERITSVAGSSDYFLGGFLAYTDRMKMHLLGVEAGLIGAHSAVSIEVGMAMATGARTRTGSTYAVSITGEAGPESASGQPVGTVIIGFSAQGKEPEARKFLLFGGRDGVRARAAQWALDDLRIRLKKSHSI